MIFEQELKNKLDNKFNYLKLNKVVYNTTFCNCLVSFIYPENIPTLKDEDKKLISGEVEKILNIKGKLECKFSKSFLDKKIILIKIKNYINENYVSISQYFNDENIDYSKNDLNVQLIIKCNSTIIDYIEKNNIVSKLTVYLNENFCGSFNIGLKQFGDEFTGENLEERAIMSIANLPLQKRTPRYSVLNPLKVFGSDIMPNPEYISNQNKNKDSLILAGYVSDLVEKEYTPRKNKEKNIDEKRKYYTFTLSDFTGSINAIHFCNKTSEKSFSKLITNGTFILCIGNLKKRDYKTGFDYMIKSISLCKDDENSHTQEDEIDDRLYKYATPQPYIRTIQDNLFDKKREYPEWLTNKTWVVFDCETTGLEPEKNDITEIGAVKIVNGKIVEKFQHLCKPFEPIPARITEITGITDAMVENEPSSFDILKDFITFVGDSTLVGYNVNFDYQFLINVAKRKDEIINFETRDCLVDAKNKISYLPNFKLGTLVKHLGITLDNAHRALYDATATAEAFLALSLMNDKE